MRRFLTIILAVLALTAIGAGSALAQPPTREGFEDPILDQMPPESDTWFSITPAAPGFEASLTYCIGDPLYHFAYYLNDHTYADLNYLDAPLGNPDVLNLKGSYLFDFGLFVAMEYYHVESSLDMYYLSPGYRYPLGEQGFLAAGFDYRYYNNAGEIIGWELAGQYYTDNMSVDGEIYLSEDFGNKLEVAANFKASESLVWGTGLTFTDLGGEDIACFAGLTWVKSPFIVDVKLGNDKGGFYYDLSGYYSVSDVFALGLEYGTLEGIEDPHVLCKGSYLTKLMDLGLIYQFATDTEPAMAYFTYGLKF